MSFVKYGPFLGMRTSKTKIVLCLFLSISLSTFLGGCTEHIPPPSAAQLIEFENAGPVGPSVDMDRLVRAKIGGGPYRVAPGEVLELTMPAILQVVTAAEPGISGQMAPYICRISENGVITLPVVGPFKVAGMTLAEIESAVTKAYYPEYTVTRPSVFARVIEYRTAKISVTGAVANPGIYSLRSDQMSLVALLMEAGGIVDGGAACIRILHNGQAAPNNGMGDTAPVEAPVERPSGPSAQHGDFNAIEVQLAFKQPSSSSTIGALTVKHHETVLLAGQIDITSEIERKAFLKTLVLKEPRVSTTNVNQRLCALAQLLKPDTGTFANEYETARENTGSGATFSLNPAGRQARLEKLAAMIPLASPVEERPESHMPTMLYEPSREMRMTGYEPTRQSLGADMRLSATGSEQGSIPAAPPEGERLEEGVLEQKPETSGQDASSKPQEGQALVLPVKGLNIPFADVALQDGDSVIVERLQIPLFTVIGLVKSPGNFPYPPDAQYSLVRALGFAGGVDLAADPHYATIYRLKPDGTIVSTTMRIVEDSKLTAAANTLIKPGDIIDLAHTPRTRTNLFLQKLFSVHVGAYVPVWRD